MPIRTGNNVFVLYGTDDALKADDGPDSRCEMNINTVVKSTSTKTSNKKKTTSTKRMCQYSRTVFTCTQCGEAFNYRMMMRVPCARVLCGQVTNCGVQTIVSNHTVRRGRCGKH
ncbi:hypothetical protein MCOR25_003871 [Pyricularia grisea]|uniref:Uncharacterized protein n=1 Tax=Pyricularia grisea TaxID=148305 RepID=A0A6P8BCI7_PYRGI|nr:uncharacterized protein PgNI_03614 [Pyricularia grisea]KAI6371843.1 hypothetical protein MCOR25_003871 [Pyricularia grisea]TLD13581.1 hypothetical protein PgNI_03614 [Pyricularia grisea]